MSDTMTFAGKKLLLQAIVKILNLEWGKRIHCLATIPTLAALQYITSVLAAKCSEQNNSSSGYLNFFNCTKL